MGICLNNPTVKKHIEGDIKKKMELPELLIKQIIIYSVLTKLQLQA